MTEELNPYPVRRRPHRVDPATLDGSIGRMSAMLELGQWPSGLALTAEDRRIIEWNLELARREREERRRARA